MRNLGENTHTAHHPMMDTIWKSSHGPWNPQEFSFCSPPKQKKYITLNNLPKKKTPKKQLYPFSTPPLPPPQKKKHQPKQTTQDPPISFLFYRKNKTKDLKTGSAWRLPEERKIFWSRSKVSAPITYQQRVGEAQPQTDPTGNTGWGGIFPFQTFEVQKIYKQYMSLLHASILLYEWYDIGCFYSTSSYLLCYIEYRIYQDSKYHLSNLTTTVCKVIATYVGKLRSRNYESIDYKKNGYILGSELPLCYSGK